MKVIRKSGNRNSWQEMDIESRQAVYLAERLVEDKRSVETGGKRYNNCTLEIRYGNNIYNVGRLMCFLSEEGVQDIMEAVEVAAILKPSKKIHPDGETVMLSLLHRVSQFR